MSLLETVNKDIITAMKAKEKEKLEALRYLKSLFIQNNTSTKPVDEDSILISHVKKLKDSIEIYPEGSETIDKLKNEIEFLSVYLPKQFTEDEVIKIINDIISKQDKPNFGLTMKELSPAIKGKFDPRRATDIVKNLIN